MIITIYTSYTSNVTGSRPGHDNYYVTFIDDATRKTWVYSIRQKYVVFDTFKKWKSLDENETGKMLKTVSDLIMEVNTTTRSLIVTVHTMGFTERRKPLEHYKKMVCHKG